MLETFSDNKKRKSNCADEQHILFLEDFVTAGMYKTVLALMLTS